jgi:hypothetical protein
MIRSQRHIFGMVLVLIASCYTSATVCADSDLLTFFLEQPYRNGI